MRLILLFLMFATGAARAADGDVDVNFGTAGSIVIAPIDASPDARAVALQDDGKIVVGGSNWAFGQDLNLNQAAVWRFLPDGSPDSPFGLSGFSATSFGSTLPFVFAVSVLSDGGTLAAGNFGGFGVLKLDGGGVPDSAFGNAGLVLVDFSDLGAVGASAGAVSVDPQGRILLAGACTLPTSTSSGPALAAVARLLSSGAPDMTFGSNGHALVPVGTTTPWSRSFFHGVQADETGRVWLSGNTNAATESGISSFLAARLDAAGKPDNSFGDNGVVTANLTADSDDWGNNAVLVHDRLTIGGACDPASTSASVCLLRVNVDGAADAEFGSQGWAVAELGTASNRRQVSLARQSDGKWLALTSAPSQVSALKQFVVARVDAAGSVDASFGTAGIARIDVPASGDGSHIEARGIAVQAGRAILAGTTDGVPYVYALFVTRLENDLVFSGSFD